MASFIRAPFRSPGRRRFAHQRFDGRVSEPDWARALLRARRDAGESRTNARRRSGDRIHGRRATLVVGQFRTDAPAGARVARARRPSRSVGPHRAGNSAERIGRKASPTPQLLGHEYLIVPSLPAETKHSLDQWLVWAERFNTAGATARRAGIWLAFHNEPDHVKPIDGVVPYDLFLQRTDPSAVRHQLDLGNMVMGGGDPFRYLEPVRRSILEFPREGRGRRPITRHRAGKGQCGHSPLSVGHPGTRAQTGVRRAGRRHRFARFGEGELWFLSGGSTCSRSASCNPHGIPPQATRLPEVA